MSVIDVECVDCGVAVKDSLDLAQYWDWSNNYSPIRHMVCIDCYNAAKKAQEAAHK